MTTATVTIIGKREIWLSDNGAKLGRSKESADKQRAAIRVFCEVCRLMSASSPVDHTVILSLSRIGNTIFECFAPHHIIRIFIASPRKVVRHERFNPGRYSTHILSNRSRASNTFPGSFLRASALTISCSNFERP